MTDGIVLGNGVTIPSSEIGFEFTRSGGPGGQHVNKVSTRVDLLFDVASSSALTGGQKAHLLTALSGRLNAAGILRVTVDESRSQWRNREEALTRFADLLTRALRPRRRRIPTRHTAASRQRRLTGKKKAAEVKRMRRRPGKSDD
jgi:ribosome-associated protein